MGKKRGKTDFSITADRVVCRTGAAGYWRRLDIGGHYCVTVRS